VRLTFNVPTAQYPTPTDDALRALANYGRNKNS
jgi:hypothetical protein